MIRPTITNDMELAAARADMDRMADCGHTWEVDEDGVCEYDQGYVCACGARKLVMAEGDTKHAPESLLPCPMPRGGL